MVQGATLRMRANINAGICLHKLRIQIVIHSFKPSALPNASPRRRPYLILGPPQSIPALSHLAWKSAYDIVQSPRLAPCAQMNPVTPPDVSSMRVPALMVMLPVSGKCDCMSAWVAMRSASGSTWSQPHQVGARYGSSRTNKLRARGVKRAR